MERGSLLVSNLGGATSFLALDGDVIRRLTYFFFGVRRS